jgi:hypothetical protein
MNKQHILEKTYFITKFVFWTLYIIVLFGVWSAAPKYLNMVDDVLKIVVGVTLIYFFNPWTKTVCTNFHRKVVFTSAVSILLSSSLKSILQNIPLMKKVVV